MNLNLEYRTYALDVKRKEKEEEGIISGYASTYNKDAYGDVISPGAFAQSITEKQGKYPILFGHDSTSVVGFSTHMAEDHQGLHMDAQLSLGTRGGKDAYELVKTARAVEFAMGLSIGFITRDWEMDGDTRVLKAIDLWEVSLTVFPANKQARVQEARSAPGLPAINQQQLRSLLLKTRARLALNT